MSRYSCHEIKGVPGFNLRVSKVKFDSSLKLKDAGEVCMLSGSDGDVIQLDDSLGVKDIISASIFNTLAKLADLRGYRGFRKLIYIGSMLAKLNETSSSIVKCKTFIAPTDFNFNSYELSKVLCVIHIRAESPILLRQLTNFINDRFEIEDESIFDFIELNYRSL